MSRPFGKRVVTYVLALIGGIVGGLLLWLVTGFIADFLLGHSGMSDREGGRAMVAFFAVGPYGAFVGFVLGAWLVLYYQGGYRSIAGMVGGMLLVAVALLALIGAGAGILYLSDDVLVRNGPTPQAKFELRFPAETVLPDQLAGVSVDLNTDKNVMPADLTGTAIDEGRPVIAGRVDLYFRTSSRILVLHVRGAPDRLFMLNLAANPSASPAYGPWRRVDYIDDKPGQPARKAQAGDNFEVRYRVERAD